MVVSSLEKIEVFSREMEVEESIVEAMEVAQEAVFIGANQQTFVSDVNRSDKVVAYAASHLIALWNPLDPSQKGVFETLKGHEDEVTCVRFIGETDFLVSAGEDGRVIVWKKGTKGYTLHQNVPHSTSSITCMGVFDKNIFVTGNSAGYITLWTYDGSSDTYNVANEFQVNFNFYPLSLALQTVDNKGGYVLAIGGTTSSLFIYTFSLDGGEVTGLNKACALVGHEDWIKCLSFVSEIAHKSIILASGSEDRYIRLWRLKLNELIDDSDEDESKLILLTNKQYKFQVNESTRASISFEALLMGHDDWVTGLQWHPSLKSDGIERKFNLLSSSADTALMMWEMDSESGIWCCFGRLGELSIKGASTATGSSGGFWSCLWFFGDHNDQYILANGKTGSFRMYKSTESSENDTAKFEPVLGVSGNKREVTDLKWSINGDYFMTTSLDQTTRLFAPWQVNRDSTTWHEFARPQIHGYDMICLDTINSSLFVSAGDEKILRVFNLTQAANELLRRLSNVNFGTDDNKIPLPDAASLPVLGLSNKAANDQVEVGEQGDDDEENESNVPGDNDVNEIPTPPLEDHLQRYTLFPEVEKLYGHGYEITCCATNPRGTLVASACKSNTAKHAVIRIFAVQNDYQQCEQILEGHNLTITNLEFSSDGKYLLSVSRDRQFCLWQVDDDINGKFTLVEINAKAHSRIIWDCSWLPGSQAGSFFLTGSRDKQIKLWKVDSSVSMVASLKFSDPVTAVNCHSSATSDDLSIAAVGLENGDIHIVKIDLKNEDNMLKLAISFDCRITPGSKITKLGFSKYVRDGKLLLASGSTDTSVRLYSIVRTVFQ